MYITFNIVMEINKNNIIDVIENESKIQNVVDLLKTNKSNIINSNNLTENALKWRNAAKKL